MKTEDGHRAGSAKPVLSRPSECHAQLYGAVAQMGERSVRNAEVRGSIPLGSTYSTATLAQLVEHVTRNDGVVGSNPTGGSSLPHGVTGNTPDSGSGESRFDP